MRWNLSNTPLPYGFLVLGIAFMVLPFRLSAADELEQHLRDKYDNKTLVLRDFYRGERLRYDSAGMGHRLSRSGGLDRQRICACDIAQFVGPTIDRSG
jgi:hypothetical protein